MSDPAPDRLLRLVAELGIQGAYWDTRGQLHHASAESLVAVAAALGAPVHRHDDLDALEHHVARSRARPLAPVTVHHGGPLHLEVVAPDGTPMTGQVEVVLEDGTELTLAVDPAASGEVDRREVDGAVLVVRRLVVPGGAELPIGAHRLVAEVGGLAAEGTLLVAPVLVARPAPSDREWGVLAPLYTVRGATGLGPHVGELVGLGRWIGRHGGRLVGTLPLLATYLDSPYDPSPYTPVSQRFWNELYLDVTGAPELAASPAARALLEDPDTQRAVAEARERPLFDHRGQYQLLRPLLDELARTFFAAPASTREDFERWRATRPDVDRYAAFRAATDATGTGWHAWGTGAGHLPDRADETAGRTHLWAQWETHRQLRDVSALLATQDQRLYLDLPVGTHGDGFDTWEHHDLFAWGCGVGAPPDDFFAGGQSWGFPPVNPVAAREQGHRHLAACLRHHMSVAGLLRLDHVMGLHRLFWVPDGLPASAGVYVRYPQEELFAVLAIESARSGCQVVGEDLGTVSEEVREALDRHGLLGMYVSQFQPPGPDGRLPRPGPRQVASIDTHDTPTLVGWLRGRDLEVRRDLGHLDDHEMGRSAFERQQQCDRLVAALATEGFLQEPAGEEAVLAGLVAHLGSSDAAAVIVGVDDLLLETEPQNVPGTGHDRPNWVRTLRETLAELAGDDRVTSLLASLQAARLDAHARAQEEHR